MPSTMVKLSDLECPLPSLAPLAELPASGRGDGRPFAREGPSCGVVLLPFGVASRNEGGVGREEGREIEARGGKLGIEGLSARGFWLGEGGIASPRRGVRAPPALLIPPGIGGRRSGAGEGLDPVSGLGDSWFSSMLPALLMPTLREIKPCLGVDRSQSLCSSATRPQEWARISCKCQALQVPGDESWFSKNSQVAPASSRVCDAHRL